MKDAIIRQQCIVEMLRKRSMTWAEISDVLIRKSEQTGCQLAVAKRTFERDLLDIESIYQISIRYNTALKKYLVADEYNREFSDRMLESFNIFSAFSQGKYLSDFTEPEMHHVSGSANLYGVIHAMKLKRNIHFMYQKFSADAPSLRNVSPYLIKEFKNRWYLIGFDNDSQRIKTFGMDRIQEFEVSSESFVLPLEFEPRAWFRDCYGIIRPEKSCPEKVVLQFDANAAKYVRSLPLHESQQILIDDGRIFRVELFVNIEDDFIMELSSHGHSLRVIEPPSLVSYMVDSFRQALAQYENSDNDTQP